VLKGGATAIADDAYLTRAIADPGADDLDAYELQMPRNRLEESEIADIVAYINDLSTPADD
jgi:cytochrome c1